MVDTPNKNTLHSEQNTGRDIVGSNVNVGGTFTQYIINNHINQRSSEYIDEIEVRLKRLESLVSLDLDSLEENEKFATVAIQGALIYVRNHQKIKLEALLNGITNVALNNVKDDQELIFLNLVDSLSPSHLRLIYSLRNEPTAESYHSKLAITSPLDIDSKLINLMGLDESTGQYLIFTLTTLGILTVSGTIDGHYHLALTSFGKQFVEFISSSNNLILGNENK